jgi:hypothetical protein
MQGTLQTKKALKDRNTYLNDRMPTPQGPFWTHKTYAYSNIE